MELAKIETLLEMTGGPAFAVERGIVVLCSPEALALGLAPDRELAVQLPGLLLPEPGEEARETELLLADSRWTLRASRVEEGTVLCFLRPAAVPGPTLTGTALLHTAGVIRAALQELTVALDSLTETPLPPESKEGRSAALALRSVFRLCRTATELERYAGFRAGKLRPVCRRIMATASAQALFESLQEVLEEAGISLEWELPLRDFPVVVDWPLVSDMLREMTANAAANTADRVLRFKMARFGERGLRFTLPNLPASPLPADLFRRFSEERQDLEGGLGLGLSLVSAAAAAHGGSFLLSADAEGRVTALLSVAGAEIEDTQLCSPRVEPVGFDPTLVALSSILPPELYRPDAIF